MTGAREAFFSFLVSRGVYSFSTLSHDVICSLFLCCSPFPEPSAAPESIRMGRASVMDLDLARAVIPMEKKGDEDSELMSQDMEEALRAELAAETMDVDS